MAKNINLELKEKSFSDVYCKPDSKNRIYLNQLNESKKDSCGDRDCFSLLISKKADMSK
jgi:hypothetical protein